MPGHMELAVKRVAVDEARPDVVSVRHRPIHGADERQRLTTLRTRPGRSGSERIGRVVLCLHLTGLEASCQRQTGGGPSEEFAARTAQVAVGHTGLEERRLAASNLVPSVVTVCPPACKLSRFSARPRFGMP